MPRKVFVQRDFSVGRVVRFASRFPVELEGKIDRQLFDRWNYRTSGAANSELFYEKKASREVKWKIEANYWST